MTQDLASLRSRAVEIRDARKAFAYKKQVQDLNEAMKRQKEKTRAEEARAEYAERQTRQIAAEMEIWKHRALEAEAKLKSLGREP
jgi:hypothetical protein